MRIGWSDLGRAKGGPGNEEMAYQARGFIIRELDPASRSPFGRVVIVLVGELLAMLARLVVVAPVKDELGAEAAHGVNLDRVRVLRDADCRLHA